jgi:decaprenylphospho-beta-D-ribofuranose 2-oxidase
MTTQLLDTRPGTVLTGWGRTAPTHGRVERPESEASLLGLLASPGGAIARGLGRSYGDAAQCSGGLTIDLGAFNGMEWLDRADGTVEAGAGLSLHQLMRETIPAGWFPVVTPGTRYVTVGGAIAADVHGKNHHVDGSFSRYVQSLNLATPTGLLHLSPDEDAELFWATAGAMGLTGVVTSATVRLTRIESSWMQVETRKYRSLSDLMDTMEWTDNDYHYSVAWLDCLGRRGEPRAVLSRGDHAPASALPDRLRARRLLAPRSPRLRGRRAPIRLASRVSVRALNEAWFRASPESAARLQSVTSFFHPLDGVADWNLLYGPAGFVQYQFAVPFERGDVVQRSVALIASSGVPSLLAVLKRFGPGTPGPLSFAQEGWTLALDFPVGPPGLPGLLDTLDETVADAGGHVYLAKDARLQPELAQAMYPRLSELSALRRRVDPEGHLVSDLSRRLGIS